MLSDHEVQSALLLLRKGRANYDYFFQKVESSDWIIPLRDNGLFKSPPPVESDGKYIRHFHWPESNYLKRVADQAPDVVLETILRVPETDNERVHDDFVEAALTMPPEHAKKIAKTELKWIRSQGHFYFLYPESVGRLICLLAENREVGLALHLVEALLALDKVEREYGVPGEDGYHKHVDIAAKFSAWEYKRVIEKTVPSLTGCDGMKTIQTLCNILEKSIELDFVEPTPPSDYSHTWLTAVEDHEQNKHADSDLKAILAIAIRDAALQILGDDDSVFDELISVLENRKWAVFKRVSLFLISQFSKDHIDTVAGRLTDKSLFNDNIYRHEYALLAQAGFGLIGDAERQEILSWIEAEPSDEDIAKYREWYLDRHESEASDEDIISLKEQRRMNRLWQFRNDLPVDWQTKYERWVQKHNEPDHPDFTYYVSGATWVGPTSPKSSDDLKDMTVAEIVEYLKAWVPPEGDFAETPEGLCRTLSQVVSSDPVRFVGDAPLFIGLEPTYVRGFVDGLREIAKNQDDLPWGPLLELLQWVVEQDREPLGTEEKFMDKDPGWSWCRKSIAWLLSSGLNGDIPFEHRDKVWNVLSVLTEDPDPTGEEYGEGHSDPSSQAINTIRGEAMHAAVNYGLWIVRNSENAEISFELMPGLHDVLDRHLNDDPSLAIRSVYGQRFPWLHLMDPVWAEANKEKIFESDSPANWDTAWKTYITFCQPFDLMLEVLRDQYAIAIEKIGETAEIEIKIANAEKQLADHLLVFYWRGKLALEDDLLRSFYEKADVKLRADAMEFVGRSLRDTPQEIEPELQERLKAFWDWRFEQAKGTDEQELSDYCWWFSSGKMDADWALSQLKIVLALPIKFDALDFAAEELVKLMPDKPVEVLECLNLMIGCLNTEGVYFSWNEEAKQILSHGIQSGDEALKARAEEIIHRLGAMGHFEFRELLS